MFIVYNGDLAGGIYKNQFQAITFDWSDLRSVSHSSQKLLPKIHFRKFRQPDPHCQQKTLQTPQNHSKI